MPATSRSSGSDGASAIVLRGAGKRFTSRSGATEALRDVSLSIERGRFVCVLGPSGCGKSTLLNIVAGYESATSGECLVNGRAVDGPGPDRGVVFQEFAVLPWMTVAQNVAFGLRFTGMSKADRVWRIDEVLAQVGLSRFRDYYPKALSGGMKQRVAIARVLALDSEIMLMDEPFGALDAMTRTTLQNDLEQLWMRNRKTVVFVTHNIEEAVALGDTIVVMGTNPGHVHRIYDVDLERPRDVTGQSFNALRAEVTVAVMTQMHLRKEIAHVA